MPTTSKPSCLSSAAVTEESTPPDMATTTRVSCGRPATSRLLSTASFPDVPRGRTRCSRHSYYMYSSTPPHRRPAWSDCWRRWPGSSCRQGRRRCRPALPYRAAPEQSSHWKATAFLRLPITPDWPADCKTSDGSNSAERSPVSRVESQSNAVASHSHSPSAHRPTTGDAKPPSSPFQDLLDSTAAADGLDRPPVPAGSDTRGDQRTRRADGTDQKMQAGDAPAANATDGQAADSQGANGQVANAQVANEQVPDDPATNTNDATDAFAAIAAALAALGDKPADGPAADSVGSDDAPGAPSKTPADVTADLTTDNPPSVVATPTPTQVPTAAVSAVGLPPVIVAPPAVAPSAPTTAADTTPAVTSDKTAIVATAALNAQVQAQVQGAADGNGAAPGGKGASTPGIADAPNTSTANKVSIANKALNAKPDSSVGASTPQAAAPDGASEAATDTQPTSPAPAQPGSPAGPNVKSAPAPLRGGRVANLDAPKPDDPTAAGVDATINAPGDKPADSIRPSHCSIRLIAPLRRRPPPRPLQRPPPLPRTCLPTRCRSRGSRWRSRARRRRAQPLRDPARSA